MSYVRAGVEEGARLVAGGRRPDHLQGGNYLAATVFADVRPEMRIFQEETSDLTRGHRMAQQVDAGMLWLNSHNIRGLRTPFGGVKASGLGREGGRHSLGFYTQSRVVHVARRLHRGSI